MIHGNLEAFAGLPVVEFEKPGDIADFATVAPRLRCPYGEPESLQDRLSALLAEPGVGALRALVFGLWAEGGESYEVKPDAAIAALVAAKGRLPDLSALFFGDIMSEENEISWIGQGDYSAIWGAFPRLERFGVRGGEGLNLGRVSHPLLHTLTIETGGLPRAVLAQALSADAPLRHLELWLGDDGYGADTTVDDFSDLFAGGLFPQLHTLALRNSQYSDELAEAIAASPLLDRIGVLDLSMGTLTDRGARALAASGRLGRLERLDVSHHYLTPAGIEELRAATPNLIANDAQTPDEYGGELNYYVAVSE